MIRMGLFLWCATVSLAVKAEAFNVPVTVVGMANARNELVRVDDRMTFFSDGTTLTFDYDGAARNNDPGGGLVAKATVRDAAVHQDDNVALVFAQQPGQIIRHIAVNVNGVVFDRIRHGTAKWDAKWDAEGLEIVSSEARSGRWRLKLRVPLKSLGVTETAIVNVMRESPGQMPAFARATRGVFNGKGFDLTGLSGPSAGEIKECVNPFQAHLPLPPNRARTGDIPSTAEFKVGGMDGAVLYYPGQNRMRVNVVGADAAPVLVFEGRRLTLAKEGERHTALTETPTGPGSYPLSLEIGGKIFADVAKIEKRRLPWEGNSIGKTDLVLPPFAAIARQGEDGLSVVHRTYRFGGDGLPRSIVALGRELLAAPASYVCQVDGKPIDLSGKDGAALEVSARGTSASVRGATGTGPLRLTGAGRFEYDGFLWNDLTLSGTGCIDRLTLVVPFRADEVPLFHAVAPNTIRYNPAGRLPDGEGVVWGGSKLFRKPHLPENGYEEAAVPYVWLGAERRGLCVFVNDTHGMALEPKADAVRIVRAGDVVRLEYDFINRPVDVVGTHRLAFGLQATPVKTADAALSQEYQSSNATCPKGMIARVGVGWRESGFENHWARVPKDGDWSLFTTAMAKACPTPNCSPFKYSDPTLTWEKDEAVRYYASEWISRSTGYEGAVRTFLVPSSVDYVLWRYKEWTDLGLKGLYFDDMFLISCCNPDTAGGSFGILEMRELVKRAAVMQHEAGLRHRMLQIHMTNALLVPSFAFATSLLTWEDHYGEDPFPRRFPIDYVRAESLGTQVGCEGAVLDGIKRKSTPETDWKGPDGLFRRLTREQHAILLPCGMTMWARSGAAVDIRERLRLLGPLSNFRIWEPDCSFVPFWEDDGRLGHAPEDVLVSSYRRGDEALVVLGNLTDVPQTVSLPGEQVTVAARDVATVKVRLPEEKVK